MSTCLPRRALSAMTVDPVALISQPMIDSPKGNVMSKLLATLLAAVFAMVTVTPVAFADKHMKDEAKTEVTKGEEGKKEMKKGEDKKKAEGKKGDPKDEDAKKEMKKGDDKKKDEPK
jgi:mannitol-specific phosphotransferase system IIBC component